VAADFSMRH